MLSTAIIIFREVLEIALILSVLLAATRGLAGRTRWVFAGCSLGIAGSAAVAVFAQEISALAEGMGQEIFNAGILLTAAALIGWTVVWMKTHGREIVERLRKVGQSVVDGEAPLYSLALVIALAMLREGAEIVMFTYGALASGTEVSSVITGSALGFITGGVLGVALYYGLIRIAQKHIFSVTSWLLIFVAASMAAQAAAFLSAAGTIPEWAPALWDTSGIISEQSWIGQVLHALIGYSARPSATQLIAYVLTIGLIATGMKVFSTLGRRG